MPELDVARVRRWCAQRVPAHLRNEIRVECDAGPGHMTIVGFLLVRAMTWSTAQISANRSLNRRSIGPGNGSPADTARRTDEKASSGRSLARRAP